MLLQCTVAAGHGYRLAEGFENAWIVRIQNVINEQRLIPELLFSVMK